MTTPAASPAESVQANETVSIWVVHALVAAQMACVGLALLHFVRQLSPGFNPIYLPGLTVLLSIEAMITWRRTRRSTDLDYNGVIFWIVEWVVLLVTIRLFLFLWRGQFALEIQQFRSSPVAAFLDGEMVFASLAGFFAWVISGFHERDLLDLEGDVTILRETEVGTVVSDRQVTRRGMINRVFGVGFILVALIGLARVDFKALTLVQSRPRTDVFNLLVYFLLALAFFSQANYAALRGAWAWNKLPVARSMAKRWAAASLVFLAVVTLVAFLLPTGYTLGLLSTLSYLFDALMYAGYLLFSLVLLPIMALFSWISRLFSSSPPEDPAPVQEPVSPLFPNAAPASLPWLDLLKSLLFWGLLITVVGYAFIQYARQNQAIAGWFRRAPVLRWLRGVLAWVSPRLGGLSQQLGLAVKSTLQRLRRPALPLAPRPAGFVSLRRMSPRQRVIFFYLALVRRAGEAGLPRTPDQTPAEYASRLQTSLPGAETDLHEMTASFLEARYSLHDVSPEQAGLVRRLWDQLKRRLRRWAAPPAP